MRYNLAWFATGLLVLGGCCPEMEPTTPNIPYELPGGTTPASFKITPAVPVNAVSSFSPAQRPMAEVAPKYAPPSPAWASLAGRKRPIVQVRVENLKVTNPQPPAQPVKAALGHAPDYSWLVGNLSRDECRHCWRLRYARADEDDANDGCLELTDAGSLPGFFSGRLIRVEGEMIDPAPHEITPVYHVRTLELLSDRAR